MAIKGTIWILAILLSISAYVLSQNIECYNCGYREDASGKRTKIPMEYIDVPFCGEDNLSNSTAPHEPTFPVCNSSLNQWNSKINVNICIMDIISKYNYFHRAVAALHTKSKR